MTTANNYIDIYTGLGYLFYSVAASDGNVRPAEMEKLKQLVKEKWLPLEGSRDEFGTDAAHYISMSFDHATDEGLSDDGAYARFSDAYRENRAHFDPALRELVLGTATAIADAFSGTNKAELTKLQLLFKDR